MSDTAIRLRLALPVMAGLALVAGCTSAPTVPEATPPVVIGAAADARNASLAAALRLPAPAHGVATGHVTLRLGERDVRVRVGYPATGAGPFPVIVYSHGAFCGQDNFAIVQDHWIGHGYVVLTPAHPDEMHLTAGSPLSPDVAQRLTATRLAEVSGLLNALPAIESALPAVAGRVDGTRAAIAGHSYGGMIAAMKAGATVVDPANGDTVSHRDPRFRAAVFMSGIGEMAPFAERAFGQLTLPVYASGGTLDLGQTGIGPTRPWRWRLGAYDGAPPGNKYAVWLTEGDHYLGGLICRPDRVNKPDPSGAYIVAATSRLFLDAHLKDDSAARRQLASTDLVTLTGGRATLERK